VPADIDRRLEAYVQPYVAGNNFSGCVLIAERGRVLVRRCWGLANRELGVANTPQTRFHIASVSKSFTAAAILRLEEQGKLHVEDPISRFLPHYPRGEAITLHHLLTHTSGIPNVNNFPDYERNSRFAWTLPQIVSWFKDRPLEFSPGARYAYSNSNYSLLALIIESVSGQPYGDFLERHIFGPAGLTNTGHDGRTEAVIPNRAAGYLPVGLDRIENAPCLDWSIKTGNGSLYSTVDDLLRWDRALVRGEVLGAAAARKMFTDHVAGVGYGWFVRGKATRPSVAINGRSPGFSASLERFPASDVVVVVTSNLYTSLAQAMADDLGAIAHGEARRAVVPPRPIALPASVMDRYIGLWQFGPDFTFNPNMIGEIKRVDEGLVLASGGGGGASFLIPLAADRFVDRLYGGEVRFTTDPSGQVSTLIWNFGRDHIATRVRQPER
jgi:CubicO group peptidase (beta-lactamase class C family)